MTQNEIKPDHVCNTVLSGGLYQMRECLKTNKSVPCCFHSLRILLPAVLIVLFIARPADAYIGPGMEGVTIS